MGRDAVNWLPLALDWTPANGARGYTYVMGCCGDSPPPAEFHDGPDAWATASAVNDLIEAARDTTTYTLAQWVALHPTALASWLNGLTAGERANFRTAAASLYKLDLTDSPP